jgi:hypothetical protein
MAAIDELISASPLVVAENTRGGHLLHRRGDRDAVPLIGLPSPEPDFVVRIDGDRLPIFRCMLGAASRIGTPWGASAFALAYPGFSGLRSLISLNSARSLCVSWQMPCEVIALRDRTGRSRVVDISDIVSRRLDGGDGVEEPSDRITALVIRCDSLADDDDDDDDEEAASGVSLSVCASYPGYDIHIMAYGYDLNACPSCEPDWIAMAPRRATFFFPAAALLHIDPHGDGLSVVVGRDGSSDLRLSLFIFDSKKARPICVTFPAHGRVTDRERSPAPGNEVGLPIVAAMVRGAPLSYLSSMGGSGATVRLTVLWSDKRDDIWSDYYPLVFDFLFDDSAAAAAAARNDLATTACFDDRDSAMFRVMVHYGVPSERQRSRIKALDALLSRRRMLE